MAPSTSSDCLFCKIVAGEIPATRVREDERTVAFMDINPATRGHLLVVPRAHATDLLEVAARGPRRLRGRRAGPRGRVSASGSAPTGSTCSTRAARRRGRRSSTSTCT